MFADTSSTVRATSDRRRRRRSRWLARTLALSLCGAISWLSVSESAAAAPPAPQQLEKLLQLGWDAKVESRSAGDALFEELAESTTRDPSVVYAQALAKIKQRRYTEAAPLIEELAAADAKNLDYARARVWLLVLLRKSEQGLVTLDRLVAQLPKPPGEGEEEAAATLDLLRFAGRVHGYLEGPGGGTIPEATVHEHRLKLVASLSDARKEVFIEGRDAVVDRWLGQKDDEQSTRDKAKRDQEQQREERLVDLDKQREADERRKAELNSERTRLRSEMNDQVADLQRKERPLIDQLARLDSQAVVNRRELSLVASDMDRLEALLLRERDPILRDQYRRDLARLDALATRYQANLAALNRQGAGVAAQRVELQQQAGQVQQQFQRQIDSLDREQSEIQRRAKSADGEERRLRKMPLGDTSQLRAMSAQSSAFTTYVSFPVEEQRQKLLDAAKSSKHE
ncbi:MAG: hypothetical protein U0939_24965 [Pirellulales bacterium]